MHGQHATSVRNKTKEKDYAVSDEDYLHCGSDAGGGYVEQLGPGTDRCRQECAVETGAGCDGSPWQAAAGRHLQVWDAPQGHEGDSQWDSDPAGTRARMLDSICRHT